MVLLQAAMVGGFMILIFLFIFLIIGTPILTGLFMKSYWKRTDKKQKILDDTPYYKDLLPFLASVILSIVTLVGLFCLLLILFDTLYPDFSFE